jgi:pyruvate/2-oxoglutarate dehydrogenase complex dihydrolipoamide dehydrogenase (E3) component
MTQTVAILEPEFDTVVIGAGSGGVTASLVAAGLGKRVALIERDRPGGECLYTGCVPSKALLWLAKRVHTARGASDLGLEVSGLPEWSAVKAHLQQVIGTLEKSDSAEAFEAAKVNFIKGSAKFVAANTLEVRDGDHVRTISAKHFVLATGSSPIIPNIPGINEIPFLTHETLFDLPERPAHLAILGGGPIGCEMAQAFCRLGSRVSILQRDKRLIPKDEPEASTALFQALEQDGVSIKLEAQVVRLEPCEAGVRLHFGSGETLEASHLLVATGKRPNVTGLGLETIGAQFDDGGLKVDATMRSITCPYLLGAGDVVGGPMFTHGATERGTLAVLGTLGWWGRALAWIRAPFACVENIPWVTFTDPEIAHWGLTEFQALERFGARVQVVEYDFKHLDRALTENESGLVKLVAVKGWFGTPFMMRIVGAQVVASRAGELIHLISAPSRLWFHPLRLAFLPHSYPTFAEAARQATLGFFAQGKAFGRLRDGRRQT